ncbi:MAG: phosphotransacetylase [Endomicrobiales bacterium]|nr:phosphotransacetylase [Endomicrobiales bacterium]
MKSFFDSLSKQAKEVKATIIFAEGDEDRTLIAAANLVHEGICTVKLTAVSKEAIVATAKRNGLELTGLEVIEPSIETLDKTVVENFINSRVVRGISRQDAQAMVIDPLMFSALYVKSGYATGCVMGARASTPDVLRAAISGIGVAAGTKLVSSFFLMVPPPSSHSIIKEPVVYADCGVNPDPKAIGLKDIAVASVASFKSLFPSRTPKVAFLSFSTKGSSEHKAVDEIVKAVKLTQKHFKNDSSVLIDGELQFDAAIIPAIAERKSPNSLIKGDANIFIFPDLNSGNISYKITERLGGFTAIGPILQGVAKPINDLSRGCKPHDIFYTAVITILQSR